MQTLVRPGLRVSLLNMVANALLAMAKLVAGLVGHSYALVADAVESFADIAGSAIVWGGLTISARPPDDDHPYGHGKAEPLAALAVGLMLVAAATGIAVQAVHEMGADDRSPAPFTLVVLLGVVVTKETLYRITSRVGDRLGSTAVSADAWHHRSDAITSLLAAIGISISLWGGPTYAAADDWAAVVASVVIAFNGGRFTWRAISELMDTLPGKDVLAGFESAAMDVVGVRNVEKVFARKTGMVYLVDMHIEVDGYISVRDGHEVAHAVKDAVLVANPRVADVLIHIEPYGRVSCDDQTAGARRTTRREGS
jgi:cation diffusion facilitator family transporter